MFSVEALAVVIKRQHYTQHDRTTQQGRYATPNYPTKQMVGIRDELLPGTTACREDNSLAKLHVSLCVLTFDCLPSET